LSGHGFVFQRGIIQITFVYFFFVIRIPHQTINTLFNQRSLKNRMSDKTTLVSAPGKVLLAGGFLVLDPQYFGIVISTSARFYTLIRPLPTQSPSSEGIRIKVQAAQFPKEESVWEYDLSLSAGIELKPCSKKDEGNKFVQLTIDCALRYALEVVGEEGVRKGLGSGVEIIVLADNDFYSQSDKVSLLFLSGTRKRRLSRPSRCILSRPSYWILSRPWPLELIVRPTQPSPRSPPCPMQSPKPTKQD
jgi:hypothetical protein